MTRHLTGYPPATNRCRVHWPWPTTVAGTSSGRRVYVNHWCRLSDDGHDDHVCQCDASDEHHRVTTAQAARLVRAAIAPPDDVRPSD